MTWVWIFFAVALSVYTACCCIGLGERVKQLEADHEQGRAATPPAPRTKPVQAYCDGCPHLDFDGTIERECDWYCFMREAFAPKCHYRNL